MLAGAEITSLSEFLDGLFGVKGTLGYLLIVAAIALGYRWTSSAMFPSDHPVPLPAGAHGTNSKNDTVEDEDEPDPPRNFTLAQLLKFDGTTEEKSGQEKPVYLSINGIVFDVSSGRNFYGPGGPYEKFAGHECGVALAKMSFDTEHLDDLAGCQHLNFGERTELDNWIEKFRDYRSYPILGRLVATLPDPNRILTLTDVRTHGRTDSTSQDIIPEGYAAAPIYLAARDKVFDMSFGGVTFYGPQGPYHKFAGRDASRALALMSLDESNLDNTSLADCTEKQLGILNDWIKTFEERKGYPIVGRLETNDGAESNTR